MVNWIDLLLHMFLQLYWMWFFWSLTEQQLKEYIGVDAFVRNRLSVFDTRVIFKTASMQPNAFWFVYLVPFIGFAERKEKVIVRKCMRKENREKDWLRIYFSPRLDSLMSRLSHPSPLPSFPYVRLPTPSSFHQSPAVSLTWMAVHADTGSD